MKTQTSSLTRKTVDHLIYKYAPILVFDLVNTTDKGQSLDCREKHQLVSAEFLPKQERPVEPIWLNFLNRWGKSDEAHLTSAAIRGIIKSALGPIVGKILEYGTILEPLVELVLTHFYSGREHNSIPIMRSLISAFTSVLNTIFNSTNNNEITSDNRIHNCTAYNEGLTTEAIKEGIIIEDITID